MKAYNKTLQLTRKRVAEFVIRSRKIVNRMEEKLRRFLLLAYRKFIKTVGYSGKPSSRSLFRLVQFAAYAIAIVFAFNLLSLTGAKLGEFGDFFGGVLNPILTFLMLIGLIITIVIQRVELRLARNEFRRTADALNEQSQTTKKQSFEHTFFQMMRLYNEIIDGLSIKSEYVLDIISGEGEKVYRGRDAIEHLYGIWKNSYAENVIGDDHNCPTLEAIQIEYPKFYTNYGNHLGHYFRTLYNIVKLVDNSALSRSEKKTYTNILRSQLSKFELGLLLYNCLSSYGKEKFLPLVVKYDLLKHIEAEIFEDPSHINLVHEASNK